MTVISVITEGVTGLLGKIKKTLFSQGATVTTLLIMQMLFYIFLVSRISAYVIAVPFYLLSAACVISIVTSKMSPSYKLTWIIPIMLFPVFGGVFYAILKLQAPTKKAEERLRGIVKKSEDYTRQNGDIFRELEREDRHFAASVRYLNVSANTGAVRNVGAEYYPLGDSFFPALLEELEKAKKYIFIEFFIIREGIMWNSVLDILKRKAAEGVDVRVMYDGMGCLSTLPRSYPKTLESYGIKCRVFNRFVPILTTAQNNRDHRKIAAVDGKVAFTGGVNLADEYINKYERFGHWNDSAVMLRGEAAFCFSVMFLRVWDFVNRQASDYERFIPETADGEVTADGYVIPYSDSPVDDEPVGEFVYLDIINEATDYIYIETPYLMVDHSMTDAIKRAVKRGVDVKIVIPAIPDKWYAYEATLSYAKELSDAGAKIYLYSAGFMHSKQIVSDDISAVVGSINFDFRSLYLHFECAAWFYKSSLVNTVRDEFLKTLKGCERITDFNTDKPLRRLWRGFFRLFSPLM